MKLKHYGYAVLVFGLVLLGKVSGLFKDLLFTYFYGVSEVTDGYFLANSISSLLYMAVYSAVPVVMVPLYSRLISLGEQAIIDLQLTKALAFFSVTSMLLGGGVAFYSNFWVGLFTGDASPIVKALASKYLLIMAMTFALSTAVAFFNALQTVHKQSLPSYIVPLSNNLIFCAGLMIFGSTGELTEVLYLGVLAWCVLLLVNGVLVRNYFSLTVRSSCKSTFNTNTMALFLPAVLAFYVEQGNGFLGIYFASNLESGAVSVLGYAGKLNLIFQSVFLVFLTVSLFPQIAAIVQDGDVNRLSGFLNRCIRIIFLCALPVIIFMIYYSSEIVQVLFKRGRFEQDDVAKVASVLSVLLVAVPFGLLRDVMNRLFFSSGRSKLPVLLSLQSLAVNAIVGLLTYRSFGVTGLAWAVVLATVSNFIIALLITKREMGIAFFLPNLRTLSVALIGASAATALLIWLDGTWAKFWILSFVPFVCFYGALLYLFRVEECTLIIDWVKRKGLVR